MRLPIDTSAMTFVVAAVPEPVRDFETKIQRTTEEGQPLFTVHLMVVGDGQPEILPVKVAGDPGPLAPGQPAKVTGLVATPWAMGERNGIAFRAHKIEPPGSARQQAG